MHPYDTTVFSKKQGFFEKNPVSPIFCIPGGEREANLYNPYKKIASDDA